MRKATIFSLLLAGIILAQSGIPGVFRRMTIYEYLNAMQAYADIDSLNVRALNVAGKTELNSLLAFSAGIDTLTSDSIYARAISVDTLYGHSPITVLDQVIFGDSLSLNGVKIGEWPTGGSVPDPLEVDSLLVDSSGIFYGALIAESAFLGSGEGFAISAWEDSVNINVPTHIYETDIQYQITFNTPIYADTIKDLASEPITDSLVFTDAYANGFASLGQFNTPSWVTTLGAWIKVPSDSTYIYWQCQLSSDTDSLTPLSSETFVTDTVLVNSASWTYYEWTFQSPFVIPYMSALLKFECDKPTDAVQVRLGAVQTDSVTPTFYGIDNYAINVAKIPNIRLFSTNTTSQETIQAIYDANLCGMRFSSLSARAADFLTVNTSAIQSLGDGSGIYVGGPIDFQRSILVNGTSTVTDTCFTSSGDMFVFVNGFLTEFVPTP